MCFCESRASCTTAKSSALMMQSCRQTAWSLLGPVRRNRLQSAALRIVRQRSRHHLKLSTSDLTPVKERPNTQHAVVTSRRELRQRWMRIECPKLTAKVAAKVATTERAACVEAPSLCRVELPDLGARVPTATRPRSLSQSTARTWASRDPNSAGPHLEYIRAEDSRATSPSAPPVQRHQLPRRRR